MESVMVEPVDIQQDVQLEISHNIFFPAKKNIFLPLYNVLQSEFEISGTLANCNDISVRFVCLDIEFVVLIFSGVALTSLVIVAPFVGP